jgi:translation initiation factor IF-3
VTKKFINFSNEKIRAKKVIVINSEGVNIGEIDTKEAVIAARAEGLDLVQISDGKNGLPVCKIVDYGKFKYDLSKKEKESARKQRESIIKLKEIKFRPSTNDNDLQTKASKVNEFLLEGDRVKISIVFRGREIAHKDIGIETLVKFMNLIKGGKMVGEPSMFGKILSVVVEKS